MTKGRHEEFLTRLSNNLVPKDPRYHSPRLSVKNVQRLTTTLTGTGHSYVHSSDRSLVRSLLRGN